MRLRTSLDAWFAACLASCATTAHRGKIVPVDHVDLLRFMGSWRIIACTDNKLERDFVDAVETYKLRSDGRIGVHFEWREKNFNAHVKTHDFTGSVVADGSNARWKMRLLPLFSARLPQWPIPRASSAGCSHENGGFQKASMAI